MPDTIFNDATFTLTIFDPAYLGHSQPDPVTHKPTIVGPASNGAVIYGVVNGKITRSGTENLVATFYAIQGNNMPRLAANYPDLQYIVDPSLPNPFPIDRLVVPNSIVLNRREFTDVYVSLAPEPVPEPSTIVIFSTLGAAFVARGRIRRCLNGA